MSTLRVPMNIVTGFLGSGKTTLLTRLIQHGIEGKRLALVINEIGEVNIDGQILKTLSTGSVEIKELSSGCLCCSIRGEFQEAIDEIIYEGKPDLFVIETTGVADPVPLLLMALDHPGLMLDAVITVVDVGNIRHVLKEVFAAQVQIAEADFLLLNKIDLVSEKQVRQVERLLRARNHRARMIRTVNCQVNPSFLFGTGLTRTEEEIEHFVKGQTVDSLHHHHEHLEVDEIESFLLKSEVPLSYERVTEFLERLPKEVYRAKGSLLMRGESFPRLINGVSGRYNWEDITLTQNHNCVSQLVLIGKGIGRLEESLAEAFQRCEGAGSDE
ncbi:MAG: GTP-binding protein [Candidatus Tectomicrobia bacterium]|nr:GTP-binding protein [Candidatus Tectomicrobia bacterium]